MSQAAFDQARPEAPAGGGLRWWTALLLPAQMEAGWNIVFDILSKPDSPVALDKAPCFTALVASS
jgi:hypothetical protein